jgi:Icc protein
VAILRLNQLTDLHLGDSPDYQFRGVVPLATLQAVLGDVDRSGRGNDLMLLTGDLASDCQPAAYRLLDQLLTEQNRSAIWLPGNHDDALTMEINFSHYPPISVFEHKHWGILMLDSSQSGKTGGYMSQQQLQLVEAGLQTLADKFVLVAMHHSPVSVNSAWLDEHRITNHKQLHRLLSAHGNVKAVVFGHVHQQFEADWQGLPVYSTPSTCVQFASGMDDFMLSNQGPAYRWLDLHPDGGMDTGVQFIEQRFI